MLRSSRSVLALAGEAVNLLLPGQPRPGTAAGDALWS